MNSRVEAGARCIIKRALRMAGVAVDNELPTDVLVELAQPHLKRIKIYIDSCHAVASTVHDEYEQGIKIAQAEYAAELVFQDPCL